MGTPKGKQTQTEGLKMTKYTKENHKKDIALLDESKEFAYSKKWEERKQRNAYWDAYYRTEAVQYAKQAANEAKAGVAISDKFLPWSGDHLDDNLAIFAQTLAENSVGRVLLDTNQSTSFGKQLAGFAKAGWLITGTEEKEVNEWGETKTQTFLILQHVS